MSKADDSLDLCSIKTFAEMSGVSVEEAINWADSGAIPIQAPTLRADRSGIA
ncbi:hypothetical protein [Pseudomonas sp.]|uniref:hypothetical protein n=1 Tax=Pseudomonas sp. TaxID=306 RepID=UPI003D14E3CC